MGPFTPEFDGELTVERLPDDFASRIQRRVADGLLMPGYRRRANYQVRSLDANTITFEAQGILTTYNVGLNQVTVRRGGRNQVQYHVSYWGWTRLAVAHGALLGIAMVACYLLLPALRSDIASYRFGAALFWGMLGFWCLAWPWILTAFHRRYAERALQRILRETLSDPPADWPTAASPGDLRRAS